MNTLGSFYAAVSLHRKTIWKKMLLKAGLNPDLGIIQNEIAGPDL